jgi:thioredoxin reductase
VSDPSVLVVGAGPTGLSAAAELGRRGVDVLVVEREAVPGGIPRHTEHQGFGLQDLRRSMSGPAYAARLVEHARTAGATLRCSTTVAEVDRTGVTLVGPTGIERLAPTTVLLATGARERPRAARLIPGDRGAGVLTTGQLQQRAAAGRPLGTRAVIVGAEHVSFSAAMLLAHHGVDVVAMVTEETAHQSVVGAATLARLAVRTRVRTSTRVVGLVGRHRIEAVEVESVATGQRAQLAADLVVLTGSWIPDHDLARRAGLTMDPATKGPLVDGLGRTSLHGVLAAGNLVHPVETAGTCSLHGRGIAEALATIGAVPAPVAQGLRLVAVPPLAWVWPGLVDPSSPPPRILVQLASTTDARELVVHQDGREVAARRLRHGRPGRSLRLDGRVAAALDADGGVVEVGVR